MKKVLLLILFFACTGSFCVAQGGFSNRCNDPVVIQGADLPAFRDSYPGDIVGFKYIAKNWVQIPIQVDEKALLDIVTAYGDFAGASGGSGYLPPKPSASNPKILFYCDTNTNVGKDPVETFDEDDELVFMFRDAGTVFLDSIFPVGVLSESCQKIGMTDTLTGEKSYVYLFIQDGTLQQDAGTRYVNLESNLLTTPGFPANNNNTNTENTFVRTSKYSWHFSSEWVSDSLTLFTGSGKNILDRHKSFFYNGQCQRHEDLFSSGENAFITVKEGPVRVLRSYMGAQSGPLTQRTHHFYENRHDITTNLRVHAIPAIFDAFDYNPNAAGMIYRNTYNPDGVTIDGQPDVVDVVNPPIWEQVSGEPGTLFILNRMNTNLQDSDIMGFTGYYDDNAAAPASDCTGKDGAWGTSGLGILFGIGTNICTDCYASQYLRSVELQKILYVDSADAPYSLAELYALQHDNPLRVEVSDYVYSPEQSYIKAHFEVMPNPATIGEQVQFTDFSTGNPVRWSWSFEGGTPDTSSMQNPSVVWNTPGFYSVTLMVVDANESRDTLEINHYMEITDGVSIEENISELVKIYPNPAGDYLMVEADHLEWVTIYDLSGKIVYQERSHAPLLKINTSYFPRATYIITLTLSNEKITRKISFQ